MSTEALVLLLKNKKAKCCNNSTRVSVPKRQVLTNSSKLKHTKQTFRTTIHF